ncbi:MAG: hypothetical protein ACKOOG_13950, partial [Actinomycetota bacterium]
MSRTPFDRPVVPDELAAQLGDSGARLVLTDRSALATVAAAVRAVPAVEAIVLLDDSAATGTTPDGRPVIAWSTIAELGGELVGHIP